MKILVINGPSINMLGIREPDIYGAQSFKSLLQLIDDVSADLGIDIHQFQSNHEGSIVDQIQSAYGTYDGIVINPAAYTHTSIAILDALKAVGLPCVEVHISDISKRETFRHFSYVSLACELSIIGKGINGYREAIEYLVAKYNK